MDELLATLAQRPEDLASWSVYADLLQTRGDPRGELISMMIQREQAPTQRLFDAQRRFLAKHATLVPAGAVIRRGFVTEVRIESPEQLGLDPFVDTVTLAIDGESWDAWSIALANHTRPWRSIVVEVVNPPEQLELRVLFGSAIETARIVLPEDEAVELVWDEVHAPALQRLVLVNAGRIDELEAELPALRELWFIGASAVAEAVCTRWQALERLVLSDGEELGRPKNIVTYRVRDAADYEPSAFVIIGESIELALIRKVIAQMRNIARLSVRIGELWWLRRPVTVISLHGDRDPDLLLPYSLALALANVLANPPPMVLVEIDDTQGRFLALGPQELRGAREPADASSAELVRRAFDLVFGSDPGSTIVDDLIDELAVAPEHVLVGHPGGRMLNVIDPRATPLVDPNAEDYEDDDEDEDEEDDYDYDDDVETQYEEPIPLAKVIVKTDADVWSEASGDDLAEDDAVEDDEVTPGTDDVLDHPEAWFEFRENWDDRALAPDDEPGDVRWPDPAHAEDEHYDLERQVAKPACAEHGPLDTCNWCGVVVCWSCADTRLDGVCPTCIVELDQPLPPEANVHSRGRVVTS